MLASSTGWELDDFGTAGALVGATVALIKERYPHLSPALVGRALAMSARDHPKGGYAPSVGFGVLDPYDAGPRRGQAGRRHHDRAVRPGGGRRRRALRRRAARRDQRPAAGGPGGRGVLALMGLGALLLVAAVVLAVRRPHRAARPHRARRARRGERAGRARHRHGRHSAPGPPPAGRQYPGPRTPDRRTPGRRVAAPLSCATVPPAPLLRTATRWPTVPPLSAAGLAPALPKRAGSAHAYRIFVSGSAPI
jgi:hypothetical protein